VNATKPATFYWYDLETSGTDPKWDRIMQFAGIRTDPDLNEVGDEYQSYVRLPVDVLPNPVACRVTGLTPQRVNAAGITELEALAEINNRFCVPNTCVAGFNSLRFDDEFIRYGLYRHLLDPYGREWRDGNSRWDLIDLARAAAALRPEGVQWPSENELPVFRLEVLTAVNGVEHGNAHDALSDVRATIGMARLIKNAQPRLFEFYFGLRRKNEVAKVLGSRQPQLAVHVSGMFPRERHCIAPVVVVGRHPVNKNSLIVADLGRDVSALCDQDAEQLAESLFARESESRPPLKELRVNRCPFVAPFEVLRPEDTVRLHIDVDLVRERFRQLMAIEGLSEKVAQVYADGRVFDVADPDADLYGGFVGDADRARGEELVAAARQGHWPHAFFDDARLNELQFRMKARTIPDQLDAEERDRWLAFISDKLLTTQARPWLTLAEYRAELSELDGPESLLRALSEHGALVEQWLEGGGP
jgi:exodeoxyribonuclease-1